MKNLVNLICYHFYVLYISCHLDYCYKFTERFLLKCHTRQWCQLNLIKTWDIEYFILSDDIILYSKNLILPNKGMFESWISSLIHVRWLNWCTIIRINLFLFFLALQLFENSYSHRFSLVTISGIVMGYGDRSIWSIVLSKCSLNHHLLVR